MTSSAELSHDIMRQLNKYGACDISDALLKLKVPGAGFLPDLIPYCTWEKGDGKLPPDHDQKLVASASTVLFIAKNKQRDGGNIPEGKHWVDLTEAGTVVVMSQPEGQKNAVLGGIMASRMRQLNAYGVVVDGRIRDVDELQQTNLMVRQNFSIIAKSNLLSSSLFLGRHKSDIVSTLASLSSSYRFDSHRYEVYSAWTSPVRSKSPRAVW